jgi:hypothetical protein
MICKAALYRYKSVNTCLNYECLGGVSRLQCAIAAFGAMVLEIEDFESLMVSIFVPGLMLYMLYIIYKLAKESNSGKFGMFVLFGVLAFGMFGFVVKYIIQYFML